MIHYSVRYSHSHRHFISFEARFPNSDKGELYLQLPSWRPGRYELGNFSKNIRNWKAFDHSGNPLGFAKKNKDLWAVNAQGLSDVVIRYDYYAAELNAGSSYLSEEQLYINPVNCFFFMPDQQSLPYTIDFSLPESYEISCGLKKNGAHSLVADNFDELVDCPLIASNSLRHLHYKVGDFDFRIIMQGDSLLDEKKLLEDFRAFSDLHIRLFGDMPCREFLFLFHFTPYFVRHGVEHRNSTVIAMGPSADFMNKGFYDRLLGISCHELYHTWNIKSIRPVEMMPYDFTKENYTTLGYVAEGVTTYYGDLLLMRSGVYTDLEFFEIFSSTLLAHFDNPGRFNYSVAESSWDTWLDGYDTGIPWRKVSIYKEGSLVAFISDVEIMRATDNRSSLDDVMKLMYERFGKTSKGYTGEDYRKTMEEVAGSSFERLFGELVHGQSDYLPWLNSALEYLGLYIEISPAAKWNEACLGVRIEESGNKPTVSEIVPDSPADKAGLWYGDEIVSVNGVTPYKNLEHLFKLGAGNPYQLTVIRKNKLYSFSLSEDGKTHFCRYQVKPGDNATASQKAAFARWSGMRG